MDACGPQKHGRHPTSAPPPALLLQEVLLLLGQQLPPTLPQPLPTHHAAALSAFVDSLLEAPLDAALLQPAAASAAPAAAVSRALAAACAPCSSLTACVGADEQRGVAMAACEAVARVHAALQGQAHMAARGQSPPSAPLSALPAGGIAQAGGAHAVAAAVGVPDGCLAHACAACSVIAGLHPAVLEGAESVLRLVDALCDLATWHAPHSALLPPPVEASAHQEAGAAGVPPTGARKAERWGRCVGGAGRPWVDMNECGSGTAVGAQSPICTMSCWGAQSPICSMSCWGAQSPICSMSCWGAQSPICSMSCWGAQSPICTMLCCGCTEPHLYHVVLWVHVHSRVSCA